MRVLGLVAATLWLLGCGDSSSTADAAPGDGAVDAPSDTGSSTDSSVPSDTGSPVDGATDSMPPDGGGDADAGGDGGVAGPCAPLARTAGPACPPRGSGAPITDRLAQVRVSVLQDDAAPTRVHITAVTDLPMLDTGDCLDIDQIELSSGGMVIQTFSGGSRDFDDYGWSVSDLSAIAPATAAMEAYCASESGRYEPFDVRVTGWYEGRPIELTRAQSSALEHITGTTVTCHRNHPSWPGGGQSTANAFSLGVPAYDVLAYVAGNRSRCVTEVEGTVRFVPFYSGMTAYDSTSWRFLPTSGPERAFGVLYEGTDDPFLGVCPNPIVGLDPMFIARINGVAGGRSFMTEIPVSLCLRL